MRAGVAKDDFHDPMRTNYYGYFFFKEYFSTRYTLKNTFLMLITFLT